MALGNLAQEARSKELRTARIILFVIGILTVLVNGIMMPSAEKQVREAALAEFKRNDMVVADQALFDSEVKKAAKPVRLLYVLSIGLGVVFLACGAFVYRAPVAATMTGLVLYLANIAVLGVFEPTTLAQGLILKVLFVVGLVKAVQAAIAFQRAQREQGAAAGLA